MAVPVLQRFKGTYCRLIEPTTQQGKEKMFLNAENRYFAEQDNFSKIPGNLVAYWASKTLIKDFTIGKVLKAEGDTRQGMATSDNNRFLRHWFEVDINRVGIGCATAEEAASIAKKWYPYNKGGDFRKWYGNEEYVINYENDGYEVKQYATSLYKTATRTIKSVSEYFKPCLSWSKISSGNIAFRYYPQGFIFDVAGCCIFYKNKNVMYYHFGYINSCVAKSILNMISPTLNYEAGHIASLPIITEKDMLSPVNELVEKNIILSKADWDSFDISWDFQHHPLLRKTPTIIEAFKQWKNECDTRFEQLRTNEEQLNRIFIDIYGLQDEITPEVEDKDITVRKADLSRDIRSFMSFAVGCMFGRYSLDEDGLIYAGGEWNSNKYKTFIPDVDNCIPITDEEYFTDDIVGLFVEFVKAVYGSDTLEENLDFIANALGNKGDTSREVIRNYFQKDFYADHLKVYQKRPIYWLFDSGKQNGFKALIYMHRYDADTVGRVRTDYLHRAQKYVETAMESAQYTINNASSASEKSKATKAVTKYTKQLAEMKIYDEAIAHIANKRLEIDLDDGVKVNYEKFQGVEVAQEGKKTLKVDLLAKMK